jgi:hypothetical protein
MQPGVPPNPQAARQSMLQMLWKPALGALCGELSKGSAGLGNYAKNDAFIGGPTAGIAPGFSLVMLSTAAAEETTSQIESRTYNLICQ